MEIRIFDTDVNFIAAIDNFSTLQFQRKLYSARVKTLALDKSILYANELQKDRIIVVDGSAGIIEETKYEDNKLTVSGYELKGIVKRRITKPVRGDSHIKFTTAPSENFLNGFLQIVMQI